MNQQEYDLLFAKNPLITGEVLQNKTPRTLLYGYTMSRDTWHVYLNDLSEIIVVSYGYGDDAPLDKKTIVYNDEYIPSKRLYAERCDFEFCKKLMGLGFTLPFTTPEFDPTAEQKAFYGRML